MFTDQPTSTQTQIENTIARIEFRWNDMPPTEWVPEGIYPRARHTDGTISMEPEKDPHNWGLRILKHMRNLSSNTQGSLALAQKYLMEAVENRRARNSSKACYLQPQDIQGAVQLLCERYVPLREDSCERSASPVRSDSEVSEPPQRSQRKRLRRTLGNPEDMSLEPVRARSNLARASPPAVTATKTDTTDIGPREPATVPDLKQESDHANAVTKPQQSFQVEGDADERILRLQLEVAQGEVKAANIRIKLARAEQAKKL